MSEVFLASYIALWILVAVLSVGVFALYHHFGEMYLVSRQGRSAQGPETGKMLKRSVSETTTGDRVELPPVGSPALLIFADTTCRLCGNLRPDIRRFAEDHDQIEVAIVCGGADDAVREWAVGLSDLVPVIPDSKHRLAVRNRVGLTPFVIALDEKGVVRETGLVNDGSGLVHYASAAVVDGGHIETSYALEVGP